MNSLNYHISSSEEHRQSGDDYETKSMLYLLEFHKDHNEMFYFVVDFFNDMSGVNEQCTQIWDLQSKANKNEGAKGIGRKLVTLFKNYISSLKPFIKSYILFIGGVGNMVRTDKSQNVFSIQNVNDNSKKSIIEGLIDEGKSTSYIDKSKLNESLINNFLNEILIVIDDKEPEEYIKLILNHYSSTLILDDEKLKAIFKEIREKQHSKKYERPIKNDVINEIKDFKKYNRGLTENEIRLLIVQRAITQTNKFEKHVNFPNNFPMEELTGKSSTEKKQILVDCHSNMLKTIFHNEKESFWNLFNNIIQLVKDKENENENARTIYLKLDEDNKNNPALDELSLIYFIALIKDCFDYDDN